MSNTDKKTKDQEAAEKKAKEAKESAQKSEELTDDELDNVAGGKGKTKW